jgi:hypothetical protein
MTLARHMVKPVEYLDATCRKILYGHPQSTIEDLVPWRFKRRRAAHQGRQVLLPLAAAVCRKFCDNERRLQLHVLAYKQATFPRCI